MNGVAFTLWAPGSPQRLHKLVSWGAVWCGAGSCDPDASPPLVRVSWGHTCGDACPRGSLPPSVPPDPAAPCPEAPPSLDTALQPHLLCPRPRAPAALRAVLLLCTEPLPTPPAPSASPPPPPCACPLSTGRRSFLALTTPSPDCRRALEGSSTPPPQHLHGSEAPGVLALPVYAVTLGDP